MLRLWLSLLLGAFPVYADCVHNCRMSDEGVNLVRRFEGYFPFPYSDVAGYPTIGFGHLIKSGEHFEEPLMGPAAEGLLRDDLIPAEDGVNYYVKVMLKQNQFDSLTSWTFNLGTGTLQKSTMLYMVNLRRHESVPDEMLKYNKARINGKLTPVRGLTNRRIAEAQMYAR